MINPRLRHRLETVCAAGPLLIATDLDGTLAGIVDQPQSVTLPPSVSEVLTALVESPNALLAIVSGRSLDDLRRRVPIPAVLAGNHGLEIEGRGFHFEHEGAKELQPRLAEICTALSDVLAAWPGAFVEPKGFTATVHFRAAAERHQHALMVAVRRCVAGYGPGFGLRCGKKALEIHPRMGWDKGAAVNWLRQQSGISACMCIGDDRTDETMFRECADGITVVVGSPRFTSAEYHVRNPAEVEELLSCALGALRHDRNALQAAG